MSGVSVALALAWRQLTILRKNPSLFLPPMLFPLMNFMAFAGGLSRLRHVPGFAYPNGYTAFQFVFVLLQSAAFGGVFTGFSIARDFEQGFARRLLVASPSRRGLVAGYAIAAGIRWLLIALVLTIVALIARMQIGGNGLDLFGVYGLALLCNVAGVMWAMGIAMRVRSVQAGPLMQTPVFMLLFLAPVYVPLELLQGWIHAVAAVNPLTFVLSTNRSLLAGEPEHVLRGVAITLALVGFFVLWAVRGLRIAERAG